MWIIPNQLARSTLIDDLTKPNGQLLAWCIPAIKAMEWLLCWFRSIKTPPLHRYTADLSKAPRHLPLTPVVLKK